MEMILNPSTISLPSIPANVAAKKYLTMNTQNNSLSFNNSNLIVVPTQNENGNEKVETHTEVSTTNSKGAFIEGNQGRVKRGREEEEDVIDDEIDSKRLRKNEIESFSLTPDIGAAFKNQNTTKNVPEKDDADDDDDDDSLPDIDIEADPEK